MTFAQLALSNIRGHALRYSAFFLSSMFSVTLFYIYAQFVFHPDVLNGFIYGGENSRLVLATCLVLIGVFAFFFVLYSSGAFLRSRGKEFGLLSLMGTTRGQLRKLVWLENTIISIAAIVLGLLFGLLFSKLFLLGISRILGLDDAIRFTVVPTALFLTAGGFLLLFQVVTIVATIGVGRRQIIDLLRSSRKPREVPRIRIAVAVLGVLLITAAYVVAFNLDAAMLVIAFLPVTAATVIGTFMVVSQGTLLALRISSRNTNQYLQGTRMITVSQLTFRMRDNARLLATIASLSAVVLAGAGTFYTFNSVINLGSQDLMPQQFAVFEPSGGAGDSISLEAAASLIADQTDLELTMELNLDVAQLRIGDSFVAIVPERNLTILDTLGIPVGSADRQSIRLEVTPSGASEADDGTVVLHAVTIDGLSRPGWLFDPWYVADDTSWAVLATAPNVETGRALVVDWPDSPAGRQLSMALDEVTPDGFTTRFWTMNRDVELREMRSTFGLSLFAGVFISLLFFIGSASMIFFKLFTELPDDRATYRRLGRIGMTWHETVKTVSTQIAFVFLLPFVLGAMHAFVALDAFGSIVAANVTGYSLLVIGLFAVVQLGFYLLTRWTYLRALRPQA